VPDFGPEMGVATEGRTGLAASLHNPGLRKLYAAEVVSGAGDGVFWVALVVFLSDQPRFELWLTLAVIARLAPRAFLSLPAGSLVDRVDVKSLLTAVEMARAALMLGVAVLVANDVSPAVVLVLIALSYTIGAPTRPGLSAVVPAIAGERHLAVGNAVLSTVRQIMTFVGPLLGVAVAAWSTPAGFAVNGATFAVSGVLIASIRSIPRRGRSSTGRRFAMPHVVRSVVDSARAVRGLHAMPAVVTLIGVMYFVRGAEMVLHVFVVRDLLEEDVNVIGVLGGAIGLGALVAMPLAARAAGSDSPVRPVLIAITLTALPTAALALIDETLIASAVLVAVGAGMVVFEVVIVVMVQRVTPEARLGRVFGAINSASNGGKLVGAVVAPGLIAWFGLEAALVIVAAVVLLVGVLAVQPLVVIGRVAAERRRTLAPRVAVLERLGILEGATSAALERIAADVEELSVRAGTLLIREGDDADDLFVGRRGEFDVTVGGRHLDTLGADDWFGEIGLLDHRPRTATVTATSDAIVWRIPGDTFLDALEESGAPPSALVDGIADRLAAHRAQPFS